MQRREKSDNHVPNAGKRRILIVEDELVSQARLLAILSAYGECETAADGHEAMTKFGQAIRERKPYDLITIDIELPAINGIDLLKEMNEREEELRIPQSKKIMISAASSPDNVRAAIGEHCHGFLVKPVQKEKLCAKLMQLGF